MDELIAQWAEHLLVIRGRAQGTVAKYSGVARQALEAMGVERPEEIGSEGLERYLKGQYLAGRSESTRALIVTALRELCAWLALREVIGANPLARFPRPKVYRSEAHRLTPAEVERLIFGVGRRTLPRDPLAARNRTLVGVMYICGLRASEPGRLRVEDLRWLEEERAFSVLIRGAKWQDQDVRRSTDEEVGRMLGAYLEGPRAELLRLGGEVPWVFPGARGPLTRSGVARAFGLLVEQEGIEPRGRRLSPHILRHSIATHMLQAGSNLRLVQEWMRHASVETTQIYTDPEVGRIHREWRKRHPLKAASRKGRVPSMHRAVGGFLRELQE